MGTDHIVAKLSETTLIGLLPEEMRERFARLIVSMAQPESLRAGEVVFRIDDTNTDRGCVLLEGAVKITRESGKVFYLEAPDILGEVQLFTPQARRTATVEAVFDGAALTFEWQELGATAKQTFSTEEMGKLRDAIRHSASIRESNLLTSLGPRK